MQKYIAEKDYPLGTLAAFSGEVNDPDSGPDPFTETSKVLNPGLKGDIRKTFEGPHFHVLIVANKFQTGFDQPLLCGMYIDRRIAGIQAVQTLSRLNRAYQAGSVVKDTTFVLDFANSAEDILKAFKMYFETAELQNVTDPNQVLDLRAKLDALGYYDDFEVDRVVKAELNPKATHGDLSAAIEPVADRLLKAFKAARAAETEAKVHGDTQSAVEARQTQDALILFRSNMGAFLRLYSFLSQIFDYGATAIEARGIFYRRLIPLLEFGREREAVDLSKVVLTHHKLTTKDKKELVLGVGSEKLMPITEASSASVHDKEKALLSEILQKLNDLFVGKLTENDQLSYALAVKGKLMENETLVQQAAGNLKAQFANSPALKKALMDAIIDALDAHSVMSRQSLESHAIQEGLKDALMGPGRLYESLGDSAS